MHNPEMASMQITETAVHGTASPDSPMHSSSQVHSLETDRLPSQLLQRFPDFPAPQVSCFSVYVICSIHVHQPDKVYRVCQNHSTFQIHHFPQYLMRLRLMSPSDSPMREALRYSTVESFPGKKNSTCRRQKLGLRAEA